MQESSKGMKGRRLSGQRLWREAFVTTKASFGLTQQHMQSRSSPLLS